MSNDDVSQRILSRTLNQQRSTQDHESGHTEAGETAFLKVQANLTFIGEQRSRIVMLLPAKLNAKAVKLIEGKNFAFLATIMPDGAPMSRLSGSTARATRSLSTPQSGV